MHEVLVNRLGGLSLPRKSVVRLTDRPDMTLDVYRGRKTTVQQRLTHAYLFTNEQPPFCTVYPVMNLSPLSIFSLLALNFIIPEKNTKPKTL